MKNVFAIYASEDNVLVLYFLRHLKALERDYNVSIWHDDPIYPGQAWKPQDASRIHSTDIFLFLVSKAFMYSEFVKQSEFKMVIDRYKEGKSMIIPILLDNCPWNIDFKSKDYNFTMKELRFFPEDGRPISDYKSEDEIVIRITDKVKRIISSYDQYQKELKFAEEKKSLLEEAEVQRRVEQELKLREEAQALKKIQDERKLREEVEARERAEEEERIREAAEATRKAEQEIKLREEAEAKEKAEEEQRVQEAAEATRKAEQEIKLREEAEAKEKAEEEQRIREAAEATRKAEQEIKLREEAEAKEKAEEEQRVQEAAEATRKAEQEARLREEAEAKKKAEEEERIREVAEATRKEEQEIKLREEAEAKDKAEEKERLREVAEAARKVEQEIKLREEAEAKEKAEDEKWFVGETEVKEKAEDEKWFVTETEAESQAEQEKKVLVKGKAVVKQTVAAKVQPKKRTGKEQKKLLEESRKLRLMQEDNALKKSKKAIKAREEEWIKFKEEADAKRNQESADLQENSSRTDHGFEETPQTKTTNPKRKVFVLLLIATLVIAGIWIYSVINKNSNTPIPVLPETEATDLEDVSATPESDTDVGNQTDLENTSIAPEPENQTENQTDSLSNLEIGGTFGEGIIFTLDPSGKAGKIAYSKDMGPMTWENTMNIQDQLGEGWRLPTMEELGEIYANIGPGAANSGQFTDELYWSSEAYDEHQARLVRFSDGNTSFHYNKSAAHRQFLVRPVRDFGE